MSKFKNKIVCFLSALGNVYKDEENREDFPKLDIESGELTEDFTAMLYAMTYMYQRITEDDIDIIGFTHILNRLAIQDVMKEKEED